MVLVFHFANDDAKVGIEQIQHQEGGIPPGGLGVVVGRLAHLARGVLGMVGNVEPQGYGLADPYAGVGNEQPLSTKEVVRGQHFCRANGKGPRIKQAEVPRIVMTRGELFIDGLMEMEEGECILDAVNNGRVRITGDVAVLVMAAVHAGPPDRSALMGGTAQNVEDELSRPTALEGAVGGVAVETYRHAYTDAPRGDEDGKSDAGKNEAALEGEG
mmetsp:Transcript_34091/g.74991  ORF Transcript_34091/g.74991 Transcript_34091/m.74991 type:complete len:215 (+) Transcript_34091:551-1195(+)